MKEIKNQYLTWDSLPDTLTALNISQFLQISRRRVYELFQIPVDKGGIPHFKIGASKRVDKDDFKKWINEMKGEKI
jgi:excisionase family DNA binding protein